MYILYEVIPFSSFTATFLLFFPALYAYKVHTHGQRMLSCSTAYSEKIKLKTCSLYIPHRDFAFTETCVLDGFARMLERQAICEGGGPSEIYLLHSDLVC